MNSLITTAHRLLKRQPSKLALPSISGKKYFFSFRLFDALRQNRFFFERIWLNLLVVIPTLIALVFYTLLAEPRFLVETKLVVRSASSVRMTGLDLLFRTVGLSKAVDDAYIVRDYLLSRDIIRDLATKDVSVRSIFMHHAADRLSRFPRVWREDSEESLYDFFLDRVRVTEDEVKGILTLRVIAFSGEDAKQLATAMVELAEAMVNKMNARAFRDATASAQEEVQQARKEIAEAQMQLTSYRNNETLLDPSSASMSLIETIGQLTTDLAYASAELTQVQRSSPNSPSIASIRGRIAALEARIALERAKVTGSEASLVTKIAAYDQLNLRKSIAEQRLTAAIASLETARQEARRQHIYVEQVVKPMLPDASTEPKRIRSILTVFVIGFVLYSVYWILSVAAEEHAQ